MLSVKTIANGSAIPRVGSEAVSRLDEHGTIPPVRTGEPDVHIVAYTICTCISRAREHENQSTGQGDPNGEHTL